MADYTVELRSLCESYAMLHRHSPYSSIDAVVDNALPHVFDFDFPIFDEAYRPVLEKKIIMHYYTREIGAETVPMFKLRLRNKLNEIMPLYNKMYKLETYDFNPLYDVEYRKEYNLDRDARTEGDSSGESRSYADSTNAYSDTPQGNIDGVVKMDYLTNATAISSNSTNRSEGSSVTKNTSTDGYIEIVQGKTGGSTYGRMIADYRESLINIDMLIIDELEPLFFGLW